MGWLPPEIVELRNPSRQELLGRIKLLKSESIDYAFVLFSGHGGHAHQTVLELNADGETINESELWNIAPRQITIYDCCRARIQEQVVKSFAMDDLSDSIVRRDDLRARYEERIMEAIPQQVRLYACSVSQSAYDLGNGAVYLGHLLSSAAAIAPDLLFKTVESAHEQAYPLTISTAAGEGYQQNPDAVLPKCLTQQQLILAIRP
ncbi:MAG: caspase family protein [Rhodocyclaceae bacterium]